MASNEKKQQPLIGKTLNIFLPDECFTDFDGDKAGKATEKLSSISVQLLTLYILFPLPVSALGVCVCPWVCNPCLNCRQDCFQEVIMKHRSFHRSVN